MSPPASTLCFVNSSAPDSHRKWCCFANKSCKLLGHLTFALLPKREKDKQKFISNSLKSKVGLFAHRSTLSLQQRYSGPMLYCTRFSSSHSIDNENIDLNFASTTSFMWAILLALRSSTGNFIDFHLKQQHAATTTIIVIGIVCVLFC